MITFKRRSDSIETATKNGVVAPPLTHYKQSEMGDMVKGALPGVFHEILLTPSQSLRYKSKMVPCL